MTQRIVTLCIIIIMLLSGCTVNKESAIKGIKIEIAKQQENNKTASESMEDILLQKEIKDIEPSLSSDKERIPCKYQYQEGDIRNNLSNSIYDKNYNDSMDIGMYTMDIRTPDIFLKENLDDYFPSEYDTVQSIYPLTSIIYDNRTIEMSEESLKSLFYKHGYYLSLHNAKIDELHIRVLELEEIGGLNLYSSRILIQSWNDSSIYAADITGPIPRKIRSIFPIEGGAEPRLIIHSSGFSVDFISEEELSFWTFVGTGWVLSEMDIEIDTSHAPDERNYYPESEKSKLFPVTFYSDGIAYRASKQSSAPIGVQYDTVYRLGKLEVIEKNKKFKLVGVFENLGVTVSAYGDCYIEFTIK